ncbi:MAG: YiiX/YebB-like N1pC/P60 family cysteine hydrolase, partial [Hyphomicrobium sp.]
MDGSSQSRLTGALIQWRGIVGRPAATPAELTGNMQALYAAIYGTEFEKLDPAEARSIAQPAALELFDLYLTLRDRVPEWRARELMLEGAPLAVRNAMRVLRYTIDIIGEVANGFERLGAGQSTHRAFKGPAHWTLLHPALREGQGVDFRAGDLLLVRGQVHNSAAIARIGDVDSQFSHIGIIHIDEDGRRWVVQALIEEGSVWTPLDEVLDHGLVRAVLFRHRDGDLAKRAAALVAAYVEQSSRGPFGWMPYDFSMEPAGDDRFFCSKLVAYAYREASGEALALPSFPTRLALSNRDFFDRLG